jgi:hypothetical protein
MEAEVESDGLTKSPKQLQKKQGDGQPDIRPAGSRWPDTKVPANEDRVLLGKTWKSDQRGADPTGLRDRAMQSNLGRLSKFCVG